MQPANTTQTSLATLRQADFFVVVLAGGCVVIVFVLFLVAVTQLSNPQGMRDSPPLDHDWSDHENR